MKYRPYFTDAAKAAVLAWAATQSWWATKPAGSDVSVMPPVRACNEAHVQVFDEKTKETQFYPVPTGMVVPRLSDEAVEKIKVAADIYGGDYEPGWLQIQWGLPSEQVL